jgi:hypothetical protein
VSVVGQAARRCWGAIFAPLGRHQTRPVSGALMTAEPQSVQTSSGVPSGLSKGVSSTIISALQMAQCIPWSCTGVSSSSEAGKNPDVPGTLPRSAFRVVDVNRRVG